MKFRCSNCSYVFSVEMGGPTAAPNRPAVSTGEPPSRLGNRVAKVPPGEPVRLLQSQGVIFEVPDLATLQRWILEQRVLRNDLLSLHGLRWQQVGDRPDFDLFFNAAESMQGGGRRRERANLGRDLDVVPMDESIGDGASEPTVVERLEAEGGELRGRVNTMDPVEVSSTELQPLGRSTPKITPRTRPKLGAEMSTVLPPVVNNPDDSDLGTIPAPSADYDIDTAESAAPPPHPSRLPPMAPPPRPDLGPSPVQTAVPNVVPPVEYGSADAGQEIEEVSNDGGMPPMWRAIIVGAIAFAVVFIIGAMYFMSMQDGEDKTASTITEIPAPVAAAGAAVDGVGAPAGSAGTTPAGTTAGGTTAGGTTAGGTTAGGTTATPAPAPAPAPVAAAAPPSAPPPADPPRSAPVNTPKPAPVAKAPAALSTGSLTKQGWNAVDVNQYQKAYDLFDRAVQAKPNNAEALYGRGYSSEKLGDKTSAKEDYCGALNGSGGAAVMPEVNGRLRALGASCP